MINTDNTPRVSIVLPVYNGERYLRGAIDSIIAQTFTSWELIIVNDCSTDSTADIIKEYELADARIRVLHNKENLRLPRSLNVGFDEAKGEYYTWTSDDNMLLPEMLERLVEILDSNPDIGMVYSDSTVIDDEGNTVTDSFFGDQKEANVFIGCGASFLYRADVAKTVGKYDPEMFLAEDYDYWLRMYSDTKISYVPERLYIYRQHRGNLTATRAKQIPQQALKALRKNFWSLVAGSSSFKERRRLYNRVYRYCDPDEKRQFNKTILELFVWMIKNSIWGIFSK